MMLFGHGLGKLTHYSQRASEFPDPLGVGSTVSLGLVVGAEFFCSIAITLGFLTRAAAVPLLTTMLVAAFVIHAGDPWARQEFALIYGATYLALVFTGAGRYSLDQLLFRSRLL
jgi:putative oxidoreductase